MIPLDFTPVRPIKAVKTIAAIDAAIEKDQGARFRELLREEMPKAEDAYNSKNHGYRTHLGASFIGKECSRELWYRFRWASESTFNGRMLRLFNRGHLEEPRFVAMLKLIGCEVWQHDAERNQFRVSYINGHFGGSCDGIARGCPDLVETEPFLTEFKTHNSNSFGKLESQGVRNSKFVHYVQMQIYMGGLGLRNALYLAVNKDNDELYGEIIPFDPEVYSRYLERAHLLVFTEDPPQRVSTSPGWWACKTCDFVVTCHRNGTPTRNCRTCVHSLPRADGSWFCNHHSRSLDKLAQLEACSDYRWKPNF